MPVGTQGTPMSYVSPKSGRQYVVVVLGGARQPPDRGDYVIAYPQRPWLADRISKGGVPVHAAESDG